MAGNPLTFYGRRKSRRLALLCYKHRDLQRNLLCKALSALTFLGNKGRDGLLFSGPADRLPQGFIIARIVLETEMENNSDDQENRNNGAESV